MKKDCIYINIIMMNQKALNMNRRLKRLCIYLMIVALLLPLLLSTRAAALNRYLRVGFNANLPPYQFIDADGAYAGMHIDMLQAIGSNRNFDFEFIPYETNRACFEALERGEIDLILGIIPDSIKDDQATLCTDALTSSQLCMIVRNDALSQGSIITTAIFSSDTIRHTMLANLNIYQFIAVGNQRMVYERHKLHPDSAMIGVKDSLLYQLIKDGKESDYTVRYNYLDTIEFSLVVRREDVELLRAMNESIVQFRAGQQYEDIRNKWLPTVDYEAKLQNVFRTVASVAIIVVIVILGYSIIMRRIQKLLKRRVTEQTEQIRLANAELEKQFEQLRDENDLRNRIIKYSPSGMLLFDPHYMIALMNKSACSIAGFNEPCVGSSALNVPVFREILQREGARVFEPGMTIENGNIRIGTSPVKMRSYKYLMYQVNRYGTVAGVLLSVQDMTEAERVQQAEFEKEKSSALTRIAAGIAHEIRNPLMTIRTFASLIGTKGDDKQVQQSFALYVPDEVDRINRLIENLIHYAKPAKHHAERISVGELVEDSLMLIQPVLQRTSFRLQQTVYKDLYIQADRDQIRQVLINILINGIEAMEKKNVRDASSDPLTIEVRVEEIQEKVAITVRDQGIGMTLDELSVCRDPFFTTKDTGTGLGLALCEQYVKENNGTLQIESVKNEFTQISLLFERS